MSDYIAVIVYSSIFGIAGLCLAIILIGAIFYPNRLYAIGFTCQCFYCLCLDKYAQIVEYYRTHSNSRRLQCDLSCRRYCSSCPACFFSVFCIYFYIICMPLYVFCFFYDDCSSDPELENQVKRKRKRDTHHDEINAPILVDNDFNKDVQNSNQIQYHPPDSPYSQSMVVQTIPDACTYDQFQQQDEYNPYV